MNETVFFCTTCDCVSTVATIDVQAIHRCRHLEFSAVCQHCGHESRIAVTDTMLSGSLQANGRFRPLKALSPEFEPY